MLTKLTFILLIFAKVQLKITLWDVNSTVWLLFGITQSFLYGTLMNNAQLINLSLLQIDYSIIWVIG